MHVQVLYDAAAGGAPLALLGALHPAPITDLAWSRDGRFLAASSYDGYCRCAPRPRIAPSPVRRDRRAIASLPLHTTQCRLRLKVHAGHVPGALFSLVK